MSVANPVMAEGPAKLVCPCCEGKPPQETVRFLHGPKGCRTEVGKWPCHFCEGRGWISSARAMAYHEGRRKRDERVARGESLFECAKRLGISTVELSAIEHGKQPLSDQLPRDV